MRPPRTALSLLAVLALAGSTSGCGSAAGQQRPAEPGAPAAANAVAAAPFRAKVTAVSKSYARAMIGVSWKRGCPVAISSLRVIEMNYWGFDGRSHAGGKLMVHRDVAPQVVKAFKTLYDKRFPIRRMKLIEAYRGSDDASMAADNTSSFNCRPITGRKGGFSIHSYGRAIDLNPVENPYVRGRLTLPPAGKAYRDRSRARPGMILADGLVVRTFAKAGFTWGGDYRTVKDYQHFERKKG